MANTRFLAGGEPHLNDIEADGDLLAQELQPAQSSAALFLAFESIHRAGRSSGIRRGGGFHLAKDEGIPLPANKVNFAGISPAKIVPQHAHAMGSSPRGRHQLPVLAYISGIGAGIRIPVAAPSVQQAQTSGDDVA